MGNRTSGSEYICSKENEMLKYVNEGKNNEMPPKREVFISLTGLLRTWEQCPSHILYYAIFLLPLKRKWIYYSKTYHAELQKFSVSQDVADSEFIKLLKWKDSQGLVFWMMDYSEFNSENKTIFREKKIIHPFWQNLSMKLINLSKPTGTCKHNGLILDEKWWRNEMNFSGKYNLLADEVLDELYLLNMKFSTLQEILYQSNPNSLHPIKAYSNYNY